MTKPFRVLRLPHSGAALTLALACSSDPPPNQSSTTVPAWSPVEAEASSAAASPESNGDGELAADEALPGGEAMQGGVSEGAPEPSGLAGGDPESPSGDDADEPAEEPEAPAEVDDSSEGSMDGAGGDPADGDSSGPSVDPSLPLTPVAFFPSRDRTGACADASVGIEFNRPPVIASGRRLEIRNAAGQLFDGVTSNLDEGAGYLSQLTQRTTAGQAYASDVLYVVNNTVVFHPRGDLQYGQTYVVTVEEGLITDTAGTQFSVASGWTFTVRGQAPARSDAYTLAADGSGDFCSVNGVLAALPDNAASPRVVTVEPGVYPGIVRMNDSQVVFRGAGIDKSVFASKNSTQMNGNREGFVLSGSDVTFENLMIFNTFPYDSSGRQAEALLVAQGSERVFLNNVHLRSHQDTLRVEGRTTYMLGGIISGSTDPLWGYGKFYCDGCELRSRTNGHSFVVTRSNDGFAMVNCTMTRESDSVDTTYLAQYHDGNIEGRVAFVGCQLDDHVVGWRRIADTWWEYNNTRLGTGRGVTFGGTQLRAGGPELNSLSSVQSWLGWAP